RDEGAARPCSPPPRPNSTPAGATIAGGRVGVWRGRTLRARPQGTPASGGGGCQRVAPLLRGRARNGPRAAPNSCVAERQSDEAGALARLHAEHERVFAFLAGVRELLADIRRIRDRLAAHVQDHIANLEAVVGGDAVRVDGGDDDTVSVRTL